MNPSLDLKDLTDQQQWLNYTVTSLAECAQKHIAAKRRFNIAVSGGTTPRVVFNSLVSNVDMEPLWSFVWFYWVDERMVTVHDTDSNFGNAYAILKSVPANFVPMFNGVDEAVIAADKYSARLSEIDMVDKLPSFDLVMLGMGDDGHTASLFPGTEALMEKERWVIPNKVDDLGTTRITLTYPVLLNAKEVFILFYGERKKQLLEDIKKAKGIYPVEKLLERQLAPQWIFY